MDTSEPDFAHTDAAEKKRREKAVRLARYIWDLGITTSELHGLTDERRRKLARAAGVNPPSSSATWNTVTELLDEKHAWAAEHPDHPSAIPAHRDEKIMWITPPTKSWITKD